MSLSDPLWSPTNVQVTVLQARGLRIKGKNGTNDAYAVMQVGKEKYQTSVAEKTVAPVWKEEASFDMPSAHQGGTERGTLHVHVLHRALVGPDKLLGQAVINLHHLSQDKSRDKTQWFKLLDKSGKSDKDRGEVLVDIQFTRNNMTASMFDISSAGKSRSRLSKFKDKVRGKKKEDTLHETSSNVVPAFSQVMTDSEGEGGSDGEEAAAGRELKKKNKVKSLFSHKTNLQKSLSQSMSVLPGKNSSLSGSMSSGLNVDTSEGKKKFKFLSHKRTGSSDKKDQKLISEQSNLCINGSHVYCEEPAPRTSRASSNFSLASSGVGSMEDAPYNSSPPSAGSRRSMRHSSPWTEEDEGEVDEEMFRRQELEKLAEEESRIEEEERRREEEEIRRREEEERMRMEEEKRRQEEEKQIEKEKLHKQEMMRVEEERRKLEEERRIEEEEQQRRREEEENERIRENEERMRLEEEQRKREEEENKRQEEERRLEEESRAIEKKREEERKEELQKLEEERARMERFEEEERQRREEQESKEEELRIEREREERRIEEERRQVQLEREKERQREEEEKLEMERRMQQLLEEQERIRQEQERVRFEKEREEEEIRRAEEEEQRVKKEQEEFERLRAEQKKLEEEKERRVEEERLVQEEERRRREEERLEKERLAEEERIEKERLAEEEEERRRREEERLEKERLAEEERCRREEERLEKERLAEEERKYKEEERRRREEKRLEKERLAEEERRQEEKKRREEDERQRREEEIRREEQRREEEKRREETLEKERLAEEERREEQRRLEEERQRKEETRRQELEERKRMDETLEKERLTEEERRRSEEEQSRQEERMKAAEIHFKTSPDTQGHTEGISSNPFDESDEDEGDVSERSVTVMSARQRCKLPVKRNTCSFGEKDIGAAQREKRQAPKPPRMNSSERQQAAQHETHVNKPSRDKDVKTASILPQRAVQKIDPVISASSINKPSKQPGRKPPPQIPERREEEILLSKGSQGPMIKSKEISGVCSLNPFEDNEEGDEAISDTTSTIWPQTVPANVEKNTVCQIKTKSIKTAHAPAPPTKNTHTPETDPGHKVTTCHIENVKDCAPDQQTTHKEAVKKDVPPVPSRRLQPVKPLNPSADQLPITQEQKDSSPSEQVIISHGKENVKASGPYALLTQGELISLVLKQEGQLLDKSKKISELEQYIDQLLVRVIDEAPNILMTMSPLK